MSDTSTGHAPAQAGTRAAESDGAARPRRPARLLIAAGLALVLVAAVVISAAYLAARPGPGAAREYGIPASVSTSLSNLMQLSTLPARQSPGFTLTDQAGRTMSLSSFRGKVVVLQFMDPHCTDICPIVSDEFVRAYHDLGPLASRVVFAAVNVNQYHTAVTDVAAFSREQQLSSVPVWHFFTGPVPALQAVWRAYNIQVQAPNPNADIVHTSAAYFLDPNGRQRYLATPEVDHTRSGKSYLPAGQLAAWGRGIALVARSLAR